MSQVVKVLNTSERATTQTRVRGASELSEEASSAAGDGRARRATVRDVASVAGVSISTVSRVMAGKTGVDPALAERVRDAVQVTGYRRDLRASLLRSSSRRTASIGLIFDDVANPFFSSVHGGVEDVARPRGVLTFSGSSDGDPTREMELAEAFTGRRVDGLVISPVGDDQSYLLREREMGTAMVFVDRGPSGITGDIVVTDNVASSRDAVARLAALGHVRIGFLGDREEVTTARERLDGYREALAAAGLERDPALVRTGVRDSDESSAATEAMLDLPNPPTAFFASQNLITVGAARALRRREAQWEVALVGFDDIDLADLVQPAISVVAQDPEAVGRAAADLLFERIEDPLLPTRTTVLKNSFIARGSGEISPGENGS